MTLSIEKVMTPDARSIDIGESLDDAKELMLRHDIRHLPVIRDGEIVGILSKRLLDLALVLVEDGKYALDIQDVMIEDPWMVPPGTPLEEVLDRMASDRLGSVLVVKEGELLGIFTASDACREFSKTVSASGRR